MTQITADTASVIHSSLSLPLARVAHEVVGAFAQANGDYTYPAWALLDFDSQEHAMKKVTAYLNNPDLTPGALMAKTNALLTMTDRQRVAECIFHGVVRAICREQSRA